MADRDDQFDFVFSGGNVGNPGPARSFLQDVADSFMIETAIDDFLYQQIGRNTRDDTQFNPFADGYLDGFEQYKGDFSTVRTRAEADALKRTISLNTQRRKNIAQSGRFFAPMIGAIAAPENIAVAGLIPGGAGRTFLKGVASSAAIAGASELALEVAVRRPTDPSRTVGESAMVVGGATLLGGAFHAGFRGAGWASTVVQNKAIARVERTIMNGIGPEIAEIAGKENILQITRGENLFQRIANSSGNTSVPIIHNPRMKNAASYIDPNAQKRQFRRVFERQLKGGRLDDADPLVQAYRAGKKAKKKDSLAKFFDIAAERISAGRSGAEIFGVRNDIRAQFDERTAAEWSRLLDFENMRRQPEPFSGRIQYNEALMRQKWADWQNKGGRIEDIPTHKGIKPLTEYGMDDTSITDLADFREFILRHELWHQATREDILAKGLPVNPNNKKFLENENIANENASRDYLTHRIEGDKTNKIEYKSKVMKWADGHLNGKLATGQTGIADWFAFRVANNPMSVAIRRSLDQNTIDEVLRLAGDQSIITQAQNAGRGVPASIQTSARLYENRAGMAVVELGRIFNKHMKRPGTGEFLYIQTSAIRSQRRFNEFLAEVGKSRMKGIDHPDPDIREAMRVVDEFLDYMNIEAEQAGVYHMQSMDGVRAAHTHLMYDIDEIALDQVSPYMGKLKFESPEEMIEFARGVLLHDPTVPQRNTKPSQTWQRQKRINDQMDREVPEWKETREFFSKKRNLLEKEMEYLEGLTAKERDDYFQRVYNTRAIRTYRQQFEDLLTSAFQRNRKVWIDGKGWVETDPSTARERAGKVIEEMLGETEELEPRFSLNAGSVHRRKIPLSNKELIDMKMPDGQTIDFIHTDPASMLMSYSRKMGAIIEFNRQYRPEKAYMTADDQFQLTMNRLKKAELAKGNDPEVVEKIMRDMSYLKDAVTHRVSQHPDHWSREAVQFVKNLTHLSTMGGSGFMAANEFASLHLAHGTKRLFRYMMLSQDTDTRAWMAKNKDSLEKAGAYLEMARGTADVRFNDSVFDPADMSYPSMVLQKATNAMFMVNMMGPITMRLKALQGTIAIDRFMHGIADEFNINGFKGKAADDVAYMKATGMPRAVRKRIADQLKENWDDIYNTEQDIFSVDTRAWQDQGAAKSFHQHLLADIENVIIVANSSTKWKIMDGVLHIRRNKLTAPILDKYGMKMDEGYYRVEHPALSLPFMYLSWPLAAANRITARAIRGEYAQPLGFLISAVAMSYFLQELRGFSQGKNRDFISFEDKLLNAVMMSNVSNILADYWENGGNVAAAAMQDMGFDMEDSMLRVPHRRWLDIESTQKTLFDTATGVAVQKPVDAITSLMNPQEEGLGAAFRAMPLNNLPVFAMLIQAVKEATEGAIGNE